MQRYFDNLEPVGTNEFFARFGEHIEQRLKEQKKKDAMEEQILRTLQAVNAQSPHVLVCYLGALNEEGVDNLILPHHDVEHEKAKSPDRPVKVGGKEFRSVIRDYVENYIPNSRFTGCIDKARQQQVRFFATPGSVLKADFLFVCNQREYAHPGDHYDSSHGQNKIFIGNGFHRFIAYGLWLFENSFRPLEMYYVEFS